MIYQDLLQTPFSTFKTKTFNRVCIHVCTEYVCTFKLKLLYIWNVIHLQMSANEPKHGLKYKSEKCHNDKVNKLELFSKTLKISYKNLRNTETSKWTYSPQS